MVSESAEDVIRRLNLAPHPEGGHYRETHRDAPKDGGRGAITTILFLLKAGEVSAWHRVDATEIWFFHAGAPLRLSVSEDGKDVREAVLGTESGQSPHLIVPAHAWQSAASLGEWTLVGCAVAPAFEFAGFEMADEGWRPGG